MDAQTNDQIGSSLRVSFSNNALTMLSFDVPDLVVPDKITPTLSLFNVNGPTELGPALYYATTTGVRDNRLWVDFYGQGFQALTVEDFGAPEGSGFGMIIYATPLPGTVVLIAAGLAGLLGIRRTSHSARRRSRVAGARPPAA